MSAHSEANYTSQYLCQQLYEKLAVLIPNIERKQTKRWCALYAPGRNRFAYVSHRKSMHRIEVWCAGDVDDLLKHPYPFIEIKPREIIRGGWEERFPARFFIDHVEDIQAACELLYNVSYQSY